METTQIPNRQDTNDSPQSLPPMGKKKRGFSFKLPKKGKKWLKIVAVLVLAGAGVYWFTHRAPQSQGPAAGQYLADTVQRRDLVSKVSGTGTVAPIDSYQVRALTSGEVLESPFEVGDQVEKGALLYRLDADNAETAIKQAQQGVEQARLNVEQAKLGEEQARRGVEQAQRNVEQAQRGVEQAQRGVEQAGQDRDKYVRSLTIQATEGGVVQKVLVQKGDMVSPGTPIAEIADTSVLKLTLPFHSADAKGISAGQSALVTISGTMETLPATVESVAPADMTGAGGTLVRQVTLRLDNPGVLTPSNSATASVGEVSCAGSGTFQENLRRTVTAQSSGQVEQLPIMVGSLVFKGTTLAVLGGESVQNGQDDLDRAQDTAKDGVTNAQDGVATAKDGVASAQEGLENAGITLKNARLALESAQLTLQSAQDALENYTVTSPISGTVIEKNVKAGDKVDGIDSGSLAVIYDLSYLKLEMNISELDLNKIQPGQEVEITADALPGQTFIGRVDRVSINGTTTNGFTTYPVTILLEEYGGLNPGMNVSADIIVERSESVLSIPAPAVQRGDTVLVPLEGCLAEDGVTVADPTKVEERAVTLGGGDGDNVEIVSGLSEGETVLVPLQAQDGAAGGMSGMAVSVS